jgi:hypothetical protein
MKLPADGFENLPAAGLIKPIKQWEECVELEAESHVCTLLKKGWILL